MEEAPSKYGISLVYSGDLILGLWPTPEKFQPVQLH